MPKKMGVNDVAWTQLEAKYDILQVVAADGCIELTANQIREFREPRLLTKIDSYDTQAEFLKDNRLGLIALSRTRFLVCRIDTFTSMPNFAAERIRDLPLAEFSGLRLGPKSETSLILRALHSGLFADFFGEPLVLTAFGRMTSGTFSFEVPSLGHPVTVDRAQIEVDAALENDVTVVLVEAKNSDPETFNVRQLFYPYRSWLDRLGTSKDLRCCFVCRVDDEIRLVEYRFADPYRFDSIEAVKCARYRLTGPLSLAFDLDHALADRIIIPNYTVPIPQADTIYRILTILSLAQDAGSISKTDVEDDQSFSNRQADYYLNAGTYLGYLDAIGRGEWTLTADGQMLVGKTDADRVVALQERLTRDPFVRTAIEAIRAGSDPVSAVVERLATVAATGAFTPLSGTTPHRRSQTFVAWARWVLHHY